MAGCPVVPMNDDPMKTHCKGNAALHLIPWERGHLARGARTKPGPPPWERGHLARGGRASAIFPPVGGAGILPAQSDALNV